MISTTKDSLSSSEDDVVRLGASSSEPLNSVSLIDDVKPSVVKLEIPVLKKDLWIQLFVERVLAFIALIVLSPVIILIGAYIKLRSPGPALFRQDRVGRGGKLFKFYKFRTMYVDAKERFPELYAYNYSSEEMRDLKFKIKDDPRVTPEGKWLRKSTLDELPNLWNVVIGTMALTGPRPDIPEMLQYYEGDMLEKFTVRPGVTGLAQASGRGELGFYETVKFDVENVRNRSLWYDFKLVLLTIWKVILREGAF